MSGPKQESENSRAERAGAEAAVPNGSSPQARSNHAPPTCPQAPLYTLGGRGPACILIWQEADVRGEPSNPSFQDLCGQGDGGGVEVGWGTWGEEVTGSRRVPPGRESPSPQLSACTLEL